MKDYKDKKDGMLVEMTLLGDDRAYETLVTRHQLESDRKYGACFLG